VLGLRPEHVTLVAQGGVSGRVTSAEYHGADSVLTVQVGAETLLAREPGRVGLAPGAEVRLGWPAEAVHVFDAGSGTRLDLGQAAPQPA
jgi:sn-glycerol 3-phosphate transport system ATP-binding protein